MLRHVSALTSLREWFGLRGEGRVPWAQSLSPYHPCRVSRARDNGCRNVEGGRLRDKGDYEKGK